MLFRSASSILRSLKRPLSLHWSVNFVFLSCSLPSLCDNTVISKMTTPGATPVVYIHRRDCGATTGYSYNVTIYSTDRELGSGSGNVFVGTVAEGDESDITVEWIEKKTLLISLRGDWKAFHETTEYEGFSIKFRRR